MYRFVKVAVASSLIAQQNSLTSFGLYFFKVTDKDLQTVITSLSALPKLQKLRLISGELNGTLCTMISSLISANGMK